jgi:hypothetical protein
MPSPAVVVVVPPTPSSEARTSAAMTRGCRRSGVASLARKHRSAVHVGRRIPDTSPDHHRSLSDGGCGDRRSLFEQRPCHVRDANRDRWKRQLELVRDQLQAIGLVVARHAYSLTERAPDGVAAVQCDVTWLDLRSVPGDVELEPKSQEIRSLLLVERHGTSIRICRDDADQRPWLAGSSVWIHALRERMSHHVTQVTHATMATRLASVHSGCAYRKYAGTRPCFSDVST